jgi:hypothetical protein
MHALGPAGQLPWFEHSRHEAFVDDPERFNRTTVDLVRPVASARRPVLASGVNQ